MNDIWSIAEPASTHKKTDGKGDEASKKKSKDKSHKSGKKKNKDLLEKKKNNKNKGVVLHSFKEKDLPTTVVSLTTVVPPSDLESNAVPTKEPAAAAATAKEPVDVLKPSVVTTEAKQSTTAEVKPNLATEVKRTTVDATPTPVVTNVQRQEGNIETCVSSFQELPFDSQTSPAEVKPSINLLSSKTQPEISNVPSPATEDTKPVINMDVEMPHALPIGIPMIHLTPPLEDIAKKEALVDDEYNVHCRSFSSSTAVCSNVISGQQEEEPTLNSLPQQEILEEPAASSVDQTVEVTETVKPRDLNQLMEVKTPSAEVAIPMVAPEFLDHEQDVLNEVTIATSELNISVGENDGKLPVYLQCQKEVVVETAEQPSPAGSVDSSKIEEENVAGVMEVQSVIMPPSSSIQPKSSFVVSSHSSEVVQLGTGQSSNNRDNFKFVMPSPPIFREQPVFVEPLEVVKPEMGQPPPDDYPKKVTPLDEDIYALPYSLFPPNNNSDILFDAINMDRTFTLDSAIHPVVNPRVINSQPLETNQDANSSVIKRRTSEEFSQYPQICLESNIHTTRGVEGLLPTREYLGEEFPSFTAPADHYPYYNARDLCENYNSTPFYEESASQRPGGNLNQKPIPANANGPKYGTVDYNSSSLSSVNNSIVLTRDKDNLIRHSRGIRIPNNSDNNYYREADPPKTQDEEALRKRDELLVNAKIRHPNSFPYVERHLLQQKSVDNNPNWKTPQPVAVHEDNRRGFSSESDDIADSKVPVSDESDLSSPLYRGGMLLGDTVRRPVRPARYYSIGVPIPFAIPFPPPPLHQKKCTCDDCFKRAENYLFPVASTSAQNTLVQDLHTSGLKKRADELKHRDDELLKTIEESMKGKENPQLTDGETMEVQCKTEPSSTLPLKKRHKISPDPPESAPPEGFPNFGVRPMMSILSIQPSVANGNRPLQEVNSGHKDEFSSTKPNSPEVELNELPQSSSMCAAEPTPTVVTSTSTYASQDVDEAEVNSRKRDEIIANYWEKQGVPRKTTPSDDAKATPVEEKPVVVSSRQYKPSQPTRTYPAPTRTHTTTVNYAEPLDSRRLVKTAAQRKEVPFSRDIHYCFPLLCPYNAAFGSWPQSGAESMILHRESYFPQPATTKPTPAPEPKVEPKQPATNSRKRQATPTKRTRSSSRKNQSGACDVPAGPEPKRKRKDSSR